MNIGYVRVSTTEQGENGVSIPAQKEKIKQYCSFRDINLNNIIEDSGYSGKNLNRPGFKNIIELAEKGEIENFIVCKIDRLSRSVKDIIDILDKMSSIGVKIHIIDTNIDTSTPYGRAFTQIIGVFAELERQMIAERVKEAYIEKKRNNEAWGRVSFGDMIINKKIQKDNKAQKDIYKIINMRKRGFSLRKISKEMKMAGINISRTTVSKIIKENCNV
jgi:site-specific DNA recombinase